MKIEELKQSLGNGVRYDAFVLAADAIVYLVQVRPHHDGAASIDPPTCIADSSGRNLVFRNRSDAQQCLARIGFTQVTLIHNSAYGEMIGGPVGGDTTLSQTYPISLND